MSSPSVEDVTKQLAQAKVDSRYELSFKGRGWKLDKAEDAKELVEEITKCPHMTALRMEGNTLGVEAAEVMAKALEKHPEFERALWSDMFTGRLKTEIPPALKHLGASIMVAGCQLVELDLSDNAFGPRGIEGLVDLLKSSSCYTLRELRLNNNGLGIGGGKMLSECLSECHKSSVAAGTPLALRVFVSGRNRLENDGATALAAAFKVMGTLEELAMPQNGINLPGITALVEAIAVNTRLRVLNLNDNTFTEAGGVEMSKVLPKLPDLEQINFGDCLVRTGGAKALAQALRDGQHKLKELILSGNEIKQNGAVAITESMANKADLTLLDLNANQLGEGGIELVQDTMEALGKVELLASFR
ncbi:ran GTPase-activating protein 1-like [Babylonia areolata]|uniref:ran GTPase-activating protein 1-like n=1 Tax=Babylonia areolata TaxID=304850 RepID=UPI003FD5658E